MWDGNISSTSLQFGSGTNFKIKGFGRQETALLKIRPERRANPGEPCIPFIPAVTGKMDFNPVVSAAVLAVLLFPAAGEAEQLSDVPGQAD